MKNKIQERMPTRMQSRRRMRQAQWFESSRSFFDLWFLVLSIISCCSRLHSHAFSSNTAIQSSRRQGLFLRLEAMKEDCVVETKRIPIRAAVYQPPMCKDANMIQQSLEATQLSILTEITSVLQMASRCRIDVVQFPEYFLNGGDFENSVPFDRDASTLNIIGNVCAELNVACIVGYVEKEHESERTQKEPDAGCYNSLALFHADGSRAGNYRCVNPKAHDQKAYGSNKLYAKGTLKNGNSMIESIPIVLRLPDREAPSSLLESITIDEGEKTTATATGRQIRVGPLCGDDLLVPEHSRYLTRSGAEILVVAGAFATEQSGDKKLRCIPPTRSLENSLPLLLANYVSEGTLQDDENIQDGDNSDENYESPSFVGQSAIISDSGYELVRAPSSLQEDMPNGDGYLLPCDEARKGAALYAADLDVRVYDTDICNLSESGNHHRDHSVAEWDLTPNIATLSTTSNTPGTQTNPWSRRSTKGFGKEVVELLAKQRREKKKLK